MRLCPIYTYFLFLLLACFRPNQKVAIFKRDIPLTPQSSATITNKKGLPDKKGSLKSILSLLMFRNKIDN